MIDERSNEILLHLKNLGSRKLSIQRVKFAFAELFPDLENHPDRVNFLYAALANLESQNLIKFPSNQNKKAWLSESNPRLPAWILLTDDTDKEMPGLDPSTIPWLAELGFCAELTNKVHIEIAYAINQYLIERRKVLLPAPLRERSLQIFGDEKRLDSLVSNGALFGGRLPLSVIAAFEVEQPLVFEKGPRVDKPLLVIENHHTYWSFCQWNKQQCVYSAVVYGSGNAFARSGKAIDDIVAAVKGSSIEYFGDLDPAGLEIPYRFNVIRRRANLTEIQPAVSFYSFLLKHGIRRKNSDDQREALPAALEWLPPSARHLVIDLFKSGLWIPQESLGTEALNQHFFV